MLRANKNKLARIFMRLEPFDLPYDYLARREVEALKDNLFQTMAVRSRQFLAARKVTEAEEQGDLLALQLTEDERSKLQTILLS
jgi:hypothetical protein